MFTHLYLCVDCEEGQPLLSEHIHSGGRYEGGVSRDDVRGHRITAAKCSGRNGQTSPVSQVIQTDLFIYKALCVSCQPLVYFFF